MATLTTAEKATISSLIVYLQNGYEKPSPDDRMVEVLTALEGKFGFTGAGKNGIAEGLRDAPFSTLLQALLAVAA